MTRPGGNDARIVTTARGLIARRRLLCLAAGVLAVAPARAAEIEPRAYLNTPVGMNFVIAGYGYSEGGLSTDPASPLQDAKLKINTGLFAYARGLNLWGKSGKIDVVLPYSDLSGSATFNGEPAERNVSGLNDPRVRLSVNFIGAPALSKQEFASYKQDLIVGASLQVSSPLGQYDPDRLVNLGTNRWYFKPEIGVSKALGAFTAGAVHRRVLLHDERRLLRRQDVRAGPRVLDAGARHLQLRPRHLGGAARDVRLRRAHDDRRRAATTR